MDDNTLVIKCLEGDRAAQQVLFERYSRRMMGVCLRYSATKEQAEDVLQIGFIKVFTKLNDYSRKGSLEGWIRRIMVNTSLDEIRNNNKFRLDVDIEDVAYKIEDTSINSDLLEHEDLLKLIQQMPEGYKMVFNMFAIEGYTHKEIAKELNISENTSKSQYSRARNYLRLRLEEIEKTEIERKR
jgi:RNA polymerase sigma factor (sigma-70 family)